MAALLRAASRLRPPAHAAAFTAVTAAGAHTPVGGDPPRSALQAFAAGVDCFAFDCDGVLYHGTAVVPGAPEALSRLRQLGKRVVFVTNSASRSRAAVSSKLAQLGLGSAPGDVYTSAYAAAAHLRALGFARKAFVVGGSGLEEELAAVGIASVGGSRYEALHPTGRFLTEDEAHSVELDPEVGAVICSWDGKFTYGKLAHAALLLRHNAGCHFVATNLDACAPHTNGRLCPGGGAITAAVACAADRQPTVVGKPAQAFLQLILQEQGLAAGRVCMVGDRLDTDVAFGAAGGLQTLLVLSGVTSAQEAAAAQAAPGGPDRVLSSIAPLADL